MDSDLFVAESESDKGTSQSPEDQDLGFGLRSGGKTGADSGRGSQQSVLHPPVIGLEVEGNGVDAVSEAGSGQLTPAGAGSFKRVRSTASLRRGVGGSESDLSPKQRSGTSATVLDPRPGSGSTSRPVRPLGSAQSMRSLRGGAGSRRESSASSFRELGSLNLINQNTLLSDAASVMSGSHQSATGQIPAIPNLATALPEEREELEHMTRRLQRDLVIMHQINKKRTEDIVKLRMSFQAKGGKVVSLGHNNSSGYGSFRRYSEAVASAPSGGGSSSFGGDSSTIPGMTGRKDSRTTLSKDDEPEDLSEVLLWYSQQVHELKAGKVLYQKSYDDVMRRLKWIRQGFGKLKDSTIMYQQDMKTYLEEKLDQFSYDLRINFLVHRVGSGGPEENDGQAAGDRASTGGLGTLLGDGEGNTLQQLLHAQADNDRLERKLLQSEDVIKKQVVEMKLKEDSIDWLNSKVDALKNQLKEVESLYLGLQDEVKNAKADQENYAERHNSLQKKYDQLIADNSAVVAELSSSGGEGATKRAEQPARSTKKAPSSTRGNGLKRKTSNSSSTSGGDESAGEPNSPVSPPSAAKAKVLEERKLQGSTKDRHHFDSIHSVKSKRLSSSPSSKDQSIEGARVGLLEEFQTRPISKRTKDTGVQTRFETEGTLHALRNSINQFCAMRESQKGSLVSMLQEVLGELGFPQTSNGKPSAEAELLKLTEELGRLQNTMNEIQSKKGPLVSENADNARAAGQAVPIESVAANPSLKSSESLLPQESQSQSSSRPGTPAHLRPPSIPVRPKRPSTTLTSNKNQRASHLESGSELNRPNPDQLYTSSDIEVFSEHRNLRDVVERLYKLHFHFEQKWKNRREELWRAEEEHRSHLLYMACQAKERDEEERQRRNEMLEKLNEGGQSKAFYGVPESHLQVSSPGKSRVVAKTNPPERSFDKTTTETAIGRGSGLISPQRVRLMGEHGASEAELDPNTDRIHPVVKHRRVSPPREKHPALRGGWKDASAPTKTSKYYANACHAYKYSWSSVPELDFSLVDPTVRPKSARQGTLPLMEKRPPCSS